MMIKSMLLSSYSSSIVVDDVVDGTTAMGTLLIATNVVIISTDCINCINNNIPYIIHHNNGNRTT